MAAVCPSEGVRLRSVYGSVYYKKERRTGVVWLSTLPGGTYVVRGYQIGYRVALKLAITLPWRACCPTRVDSPR
jgi:hypothetical protein